MIPLAGALVGGIVGGPLGFVAGAKLGGVAAAVGGGVIGLYAILFTLSLLNLKFDWKYSDQAKTKTLV